MEIKKLNAPEFDIPKMLCDFELSPKLNPYPWFQENLNRSTVMCICGKQGSGKTSFLLQLLTQKKSPMYKVFHNIYLFMPPNSRSSVKNNPFEKGLPEDQIFDELNYENLLDVYHRIEADSIEGYTSLIIFDDVQEEFSRKECEKGLKKFTANMRHMRCSLYFIQQNFHSICTAIRDLTHVYIVFDQGKRINTKIFEQLVQGLDKKEFDELIKLVFKKDHDKLTINTRSHKLYKNFDEIVIDK